DDDQVIYGYAGADPGFLINFDQLFPGAGHHALEVNYRCPTDVVASATNLLSHNRRRLDKVIRVSSTDSGLEVATVAGDDLAATAVARIARLVQGGVSPSSVAVLARVNSALLPVPSW